MENEQMEQETILLPESAPYGVPAEQMAEGYRAFQKKFLRRGFWIRVGLVLFCLADFLGVAIWRFVNGRSVNSMTYVLIVLCAALLFVLWYNPKKTRNSVLNAAKQLERDRYTVTFRAHDLVIRTILPPQEAPEEDEAMIQWFLETHPDYTLTDWHETSLGRQVAGIPGYAGLSDGLAGIFPDEISSKVLRLWPHKLRGEGHFAARLQKSGTPLPVSLLCDAAAGTKNSSKGKKKKGKQNKKKPELTDFTEFKDTYLNTSFSPYPALAGGRMELFGDELYLIPAPVPSLAGLKVLRTGLHLGTRKKNRFEPAHALAKTLVPTDAQQSLDCIYEDACRYLQGETISCPDTWKGWTLVCYEGCTLGWGKARNGLLKNHYPKGLRIQGWNDPEKK